MMYEIKFSVLKEEQLHFPKANTLITKIPIKKFKSPEKRA